MSKSDLVFGEEKKVLLTTLSTMILGYSLKINAYAKLGSINPAEEYQELKEILNGYLDQMIESIASDSEDAG